MRKNQPSRKIPVARLSAAGAEMKLESGYFLPVRYKPTSAFRPVVRKVSERALSDLVMSDGVNCTDRNVGIAAIKATFASRTSVSITPNNELLLDRAAIKFSNTKHDIENRIIQPETPFNVSRHYLEQLAVLFGTEAFPIGAAMGGLIMGNPNRIEELEDIAKTLLQVGGVHGIPFIKVNADGNIDSTPHQQLL